MSNTEYNLNLIFLGQLAQIITLCSLMAIGCSVFIKENRDSEYLFYGVDNESLFSFKVFVSTWLLLTRYIPFDVILQTETGKIFYSKLMEFDL